MQHVPPLGRPWLGQKRRMLSPRGLGLMMKRACLGFVVAVIVEIVVCVGVVVGWVRAAMAIGRHGVIGRGDEIGEDQRRVGTESWVGERGDPACRVLVLACCHVVHFAAVALVARGDHYPDGDHPVEADVIPHEGAACSRVACSDPGAYFATEAHQAC